MAHVINKLPYDMRKDWVKESLAIQQRISKVAKFSDFVKFVEREAEAANSLYTVADYLRLSQNYVARPNHKNQTRPSLPLLSLLFLTNPIIWKGWLSSVTIALNSITNCRLVPDSLILLFLTGRSL